MSSTDEDPEARLAQAFAWKTRLQSADARLPDFEVFEEWLALPHAREAFDRAERVLDDVELHREIIARVMSDHDAADESAKQALSARQAARRRLVTTGVGLGFGALAASAAGFAVWAPQVGWSNFETAKGQTRTIKLADGTIVHLNSASAIRTNLSGGARRVAMGVGEASFEVAHDAARPFIVAAGDRRVRVIGTEFNILNTRGRFAVTVRRGIVEVAGKEPGVLSATRLVAGDQWDSREGGIVRSAGSAERAFAWQSGRLIYDDAPLADIAADLERYYEGPIGVDANASNIRFSGVLVLDGRANILQRLQAFLPVSIASEGDKTVLRARAAL